ncbi:MAG: hypothetical protein HQM04_18585 [Magnetococcales bacterium]|nr:hypothetical protein [Magnetococcales bacterium]
MSIPAATWRSVSRVNDGNIIIVGLAVDGKSTRFPLSVQDAFQLADSIFQFLAINAGLAPASTLTQIQAHPCEQCPIRNALLHAHVHLQQQDPEIRNCQGYVKCNDNALI